MCHRCWTIPCICNPTIPQWEKSVALRDHIAELRTIEAEVVAEAEHIAREAATR